MLIRCTRYMIFGLFLGLCGACTSQNIYSVKSYKYFTDDEVHVIAILPSGHTEKFLCSFPANTDYQHMKKVKVGNVKSEYLLGGTLYYCKSMR